MTVVALLLSAAAAGLATVRWARVAQREHYIAGSVSRFAVRWWLRRPPNPVLAATAVVALIVGFWSRPLALLALAAVAAGPVGLRLRGRTSPLRWTPRLRRLVATAAVFEAGALAATALTGTSEMTAPLVAALVPVIVDAAVLAMVPVERALSQKYVRQAADTLRRVSPRVVAITGSYGKTSTKEHVRDLVSGSFEVVASPASFNNRLGLAKAVNDAVGPGTEVFVAEMGTFAQGEIADLCTWIKPTVSVLTAVGPVHLERFGSLDAIAEAKSEIFAGASQVVINADDQRVSEVAARKLEPAAVLRCSASDPTAAVFVESRDRGFEVRINGGAIGVVTADVFPVNVACAVGAALALGVPVDAIASRLSRLGAPAHRAQVSEAGSGVTIIDDTYNSNPDGAAAALRLLDRMGSDAAHKVVVTPGMIELGARQTAENEIFGAAAGQIATHLVVVGHSNKAALLAGAQGTDAEVVVVADRDAASKFVRTILSSGDLVLYENDLPDHHP
ncbi:MAG TPA: UDP-N-acetylmuramoyl-tripeptide--D-alanyl-D-alanine ligase [Acidimicrobiales bacterium]|nr:UDP-N-acetylmuramoyl-tripeptide--D-alanyl-D-alanine ligase [Acidimicrobiales bacterium]